MENPVQVRDIDVSRIEPPYSLDLARAVVGDYMDNGARYLGAHFKHQRYKKAEFLLTGIVDETSPDLSDPRAKLMVQGGTQLGCSTRECDFCVYADLPFYGNLGVQEIVDIYRASLFLYSKTRPLETDQRRLDLKFTDNGEPLESRRLTEAMSGLLDTFGHDRKILGFKVSSIFRDFSNVRANFDRLCEWQEAHRAHASTHLQISRPFSGEHVIPSKAVAEVISRWAQINPRDSVCITPGIVRGFNEEEMIRFLESLQVQREQFFIRLAVIKPSTQTQESQVMPRTELQRIHARIAALDLDVRPLQSDDTYEGQLRGAGTLSHLPDGNTFDPRTYKPWEFAQGKTDPNLQIVNTAHMRTDID